MARTPISGSAGSLKVKLRSHFFSLYNKANLLPTSGTPTLLKFLISRTKPWVPLHTFHCFSLNLSKSIANQVCNVHTHQDNGLIGQI